MRYPPGCTVTCDTGGVIIAPVLPMRPLPPHPSNIPNAIAAHVLLSGLRVFTKGRKTNASTPTPALLQTTPCGSRAPATSAVPMVTVSVVCGCPASAVTLKLFAPSEHVGSVPPLAAPSNVTEQLRLTVPVNPDPLGLTYTKSCATGLITDNPGVVEFGNVNPIRKDEFASGAMSKYCGLDRVDYGR